MRPEHRAGSRYDFGGVGEDALQQLVDLWCRGERSDGVREEIGRLCRALARRAGKGAGLDDADADEVAQKTALAFDRAYLGRKVPLDRAEAMAMRIALNAARDVHRRRSRAETKRHQLEQEAVVGPLAEAGAEERLLAAERQAALQIQLRVALQDAPETYRRVIELHFFEEQSIEEITNVYLAEMRAAGEVAPGEEDLAAKRARNRVDQHLSRAKRWLKRRLLASMEGSS